MFCRISRDMSLCLPLDCYEKLSPVNGALRDTRSFLLASQRQPSVIAGRALFIAVQRGRYTFIMLARPRWNFFPQFSYIFWPSLMIQHDTYIMFRLLFFLLWVWKEKSCKKKEVSKHFTLSFMRCWCYLPVRLVYLGTVSLWTLISATADSHCQKPKSLQIISHTRQACTRLCSSWKPSVCCCFHNHKIEAVLSEQHSVGFDWSKRERKKKKKKRGLGKAQVRQVPAIIWLFLLPSVNKQWRATATTGVINLQLRWIHSIFVEKKLFPNTQGSPSELRKSMGRQNIKSSCCSKNPHMPLIIYLTLPERNFSPSPIWGFCSQCPGDVTRQLVGQEICSWAGYLLCNIWDFSPRWGCKAHYPPHSR